MPINISSQHQKIINYRQSKKLRIREAADETGCGPAQVWCNQKRVIWVKLWLLYDVNDSNHKYIIWLMMARALACSGDKTIYGEIISATASRFEGNKAIARTYEGIMQ